MDAWGERGGVGVSLEFAGRVKRGSFVLDASVTVETGEVVALLSPNGAGKSTLLRTLAGRGRLDSGQLAIDGSAVDAPASRTFVPAERRHLGVVFQDHRLFPHLRVLDVAFGPRSAGISRTAAHRSAR